jgi:hypothetical protein
MKLFWAVQSQGEDRCDGGANHWCGRSVGTACGRRGVGWACDHGGVLDRRTRRLTLLPPRQPPPELEADEVLSGESDTRGEEEGRELRHQPRAKGPNAVGAVACSPWPGADGPSADGNEQRVCATNGERQTT